MSFRKQSFLSGGVLFLVFLFLIKCHSGKIVSSFQVIPYPTDNELTSEKIELGRKLFFDKRLSINETVSCSSCHLPQYAFTDRKKVSEGIYGRKTERNSPSILNAAYLKTVMYDAHLPTLEMQVIVPIQEHTEMGMNMVELLKRLKSIDEYQVAAKKIFSRDFDAWVLTRSIASYERSLTSKNSRFDQYYYQKKKDVLTTGEKRGWKLFSEKLYCTKCHPAPFFTTFLPENNGLYKEYTHDKVFGFSQGAIMTIGLALSSEIRLEKYTAASGRTLPEFAEAGRKMSPSELGHRKINVVHGIYDSKLPISMARATDKILRSLKLDLTYKEYSAEHEIPNTLIEDLKKWLR